MNYVVIDGDSILYRCGFAAQHRIYECEGISFNSKKALNEYLTLPPTRAVRGDITSRIDVEPVENALANVKNTIESILHATEASDYVIYVSSNTPTFRDTLATIRPYKGNRSENSKPVHYEACRNYIIDVWKAEECFGIEADDMVAIECIKNPRSILVSNDKDLLQVPGIHFNWTKPEEDIYTITKEDALHYKYIQILAGDATDNIVGIPGLGEKGAAKLLQNMYGSSEEEYDEICSLYYLERLGDEEGLQQYNETKALITILTNVEQIESVTNRENN